MKKNETVATKRAANKSATRASVRERGKKNAMAGRVQRGTPDKKNLPITVLMKFRLVINTAKQHYRWVEQECGVNGAQLWALWEISRAEGMRVSDLGAALAMHQSSASNLLDKLVRSGLVTRGRSAEDQRVVTLELTRKGAAVLARAPKPARGLLPEALHRMPAASLAALDDHLLQLLKAMKARDRTATATPLGIMLGEG